MSSPVYSAETSETNHRTLPRKKRIVWILLACCIQMIYLPTSNRVTGGMEPKLPIDIFPVWPGWVLPYVLCYILWFASFTRVILKADDRQFRSFLAACILTFTLGVSTFIFFPTYVKPVFLQGSDIFTSILRIFHEETGRYAALPSGHVYITTLLTLFFSRWYPRSRLLWILILIVVSLSTLFTRQHYILDVLGGYLVALAGYYFGLWWAGFYSVQHLFSRRSGKSITSSTLN